MDSVKMNDGQVKPRSNKPCQRRLAGPARPEDENAFWQVHGINALQEPIGFLAATTIS